MNQHCRNEHKNSIFISRLNCVCCWLVCFNAMGDRFLSTAVPNMLLRRMEFHRWTSLLPWAIYAESNIELRILEVFYCVDEWVSENNSISKVPLSICLTSYGLNFAMFGKSMKCVDMRFNTVIWLLFYWLKLKMKSTTITKNLYSVYKNEIEEIICSQERGRLSVAAFGLWRFCTADWAFSLLW